MTGVLNPTENFPLGCVFKLYIYLSVAEKIPPQLLTFAPALKRGENQVLVPLFKGDLGGSGGLKTRPSGAVVTCSGNDG
jgi:glutathionylspermidine synthase